MNALDAGLTPSAGYGIVVGLGLGFAILVSPWSAVNNVGHACSACDYAFTP